MHADSAYEATHKLLEQSPNITAIFSCNDDIAEFVVKAIHERGLRVPEDISVIGFDDTEVATKTQPPLTTMRVEKELMGALAVRQLYERALNTERPPITMMMGTKLIERDSVIYLDENNH